jgi:hypothetical protein
MVANVVAKTLPPLEGVGKLVSICSLITSCKAAPIDAFSAVGFVYYKIRYHSLVFGWGYDAIAPIKKAPLMTGRSKKKVTEPYRTKL